MLTSLMFIRLAFSHLRLSEGNRAHTRKTNEKGQDYDSAVDKVVIRNMTIRNSGEEAIRIRYFTTRTLIQHNKIRDTGRFMYKFGGDEGNGEGVCELITICRRVDLCIIDWPLPVRRASIAFDSAKQGFLFEFQNRCAEGLRKHNKSCLDTPDIANIVPLDTK